MSNGLYRLEPCNHVVLKHDTDTSLQAHDGDESPSVDVLVASGDCFVTLATRLDQVSAGLPTDSAEHMQLEKTISILLALQRNYKLLRKTSPDASSL